MTDRQYLLGISAYYHDSSAALLCNGEVVAVMAEERLSKIKHDKSFPQLAIDFCLGRAGITADDLHSVVFYEEPSLKFSRILTTSLAGFPKSWPFFYHAMRRWITERLWTKIKISSALNVSPDKIFYVPHHISHAAHAFFNSPFEQASVITVDATGEWTCTSIAQGNKHSDKPLQLSDEWLYPDSLGLTYSAFTAFLGFTPNSDECSTMALAGFGKPAWEKAIQAIMKIDLQQVYKIDPHKINISSFKKNIFSKEFLAIFGPPRKTSPGLPFDCLIETPSEVDPDSKRYADIAASLQNTLEQTLYTLADKALAQSPSKQLCLAGGVANNCVAIAKLTQKYGAENIFVPLDPGDGGSAIGAAQAHYFRINKKCPPPLFTPYLGKDPQTNVLQDVLKNIHTLDWSRYLPETTRLFSAQDLVIQTFSDDQALIEETAAQLHRGTIVGWVQDRAEFGPRALGNRSILADPGNIDVVRRLSRCVKYRAAFRPYALSLTEETARHVLFMGDSIPLAARWMQMTLEVKPAFRSFLRGALAIDGTTRPHILTRADNPRYYDLLNHFGAKHGLSAVLNTSFNEAGSPIVSSGLDALISFVRMDLDMLVVDNVMIKKPWCVK